MPLYKDLVIKLILLMKQLTSLEYHKVILFNSSGIHSSFSQNFNDKCDGPVLEVFSKQNCVFDSLEQTTL